MALFKNRIVAIGNNLQHDRDFRKYEKIDLKGINVIPGMVDSHVHFYYMALTLGKIRLEATDSVDSCLTKIKQFASRLKKDEWVVGEGFSPDRFKSETLPDLAMLDKVCGGRPAFIFSKDQHSCWVNSRALSLASVDYKSADPDGGEIDHDSDGNLTGFLREGPAISLVYRLIPTPKKQMVDRLYKQALDIAYRNGVTGIHSFDGPAALDFWQEKASQGKVGLRVNHYPPADLLPRLLDERIYFGRGDEFYRIAGVKIFADGALGSQTALCFNKYIGSKGNYGIETTTVAKMKKQLQAASRLNLPGAIHAIGDKAVDNVLTAFESSPSLSFGARHRIEHLQLIRRSDVKRLVVAGITASMQPSHCPADILLTRKYWGKRGANSFIFRTLLDKGIALAFGSDAPIEPLEPIAGISAAVRRSREGRRDSFYPEQKLTAAEALFAYTAAPPHAVGQEQCRGYLLPGYPADFVLLDQDITKVAASKIAATSVLATVLDGRTVYRKSRFTRL